MQLTKPVKGKVHTETIPSPVHSRRLQSALGVAAATDVDTIKLVPDAVLKEAERILRPIKSEGRAKPEG